jgi:hypothetical protein
MSDTPDFYPRMTVHTDESAVDNRMFVASIHDMDSDVIGVKADHSGPTHAAASITLVFKTHEEP